VERHPDFTVDLGGTCSCGSSGLHSWIVLSRSTSRAHTIASYLRLDTVE